MPRDQKKKQIDLPIALYEKLRLASTAKYQASITSYATHIILTYLEKHHPDLINPEKEAPPQLLPYWQVWDLDRYPSDAQLHVTPEDKHRVSLHLGKGGLTSIVRDAEETHEARTREEKLQAFRDEDAEFGFD